MSTQTSTPASGMTIDVWSDVACPWCLIGKRRFDRAVAQLGFGEQLHVVYHSFQLDPGLPAHHDGTEAEYLAQSKHLAPEQVSQMLAQVAEVAAGEGLHYDFEHLVVANSLLAHRLLHGARALDESGQASGLQQRVKEALLVGHFEQGRDIGDVEQLVAMATSAGMDAEAARTVLGSEEIDVAVHLDIATANGYGITGVPFYVIGQRYGLSGAQPTEVFVEAITEAWNQTHAQPVLQPLSGAGQACGPDGCA